MFFGSGMSRRGSLSPLYVIEIGGGSGSNALYTLDYIHKTAPDIYANNFQYKIIEISRYVCAYKYR